MAATYRRLARLLRNRKKKKKNFVVGAEEELAEVFATLTATARNVLKFYDIKIFLFREAAVEIRSLSPDRALLYAGYTIRRSQVLAFNFHVNF